MTAEHAGAIRFDERMSATDALMWSIERDPMLRSTVLCVMILDGPPDAERFRGAIARSLERVPRLRQRVAIDPLGAAPPRWETDRNFDLGYHVRHARAPGAGTLRDVLDLAEPMEMQAFDKDRPLWELMQVEGLEGGRHALLLKLHHAISDGVGLVRMTSSLVERTREPDPRRESAAPSLLENPGPTTEQSAFREALAAVRYRTGADLEGALASTESAGRLVVRALMSPGTTLAEGWHLAASLARYLRPVSAPLSPLMCTRSLSSHLDTLATTVPAMKAAALAAGGTVNDAFVAAVMGGLRRYHELHDRPVDELRMTMPINLREGEEGRRAGNQFAPARFTVPVSIADPVARMRAIHERVVAQRSEPALPYNATVSGVLGRLPTSVATVLLGALLKAIDVVTSNVPGPQFPVYASGARVLEMIGYGPLSGSAMNVTAYSYDGRFQIGVNIDRVAVPDPESFMRCLREGLEEVLAAGSERLGTGDALR